jgi:ABC-type uncharacterized transport system auxiliary subunit
VFQYLVPVQGRGTAAVVAALDRGMEQAFSDIAGWAFG